MAVRGTVDQGAGGTLVTSVTGTANQITVTPTTGAAVVSIASGFVATPTQGGKPSNRYSANTFQNPTGNASATKVMMGLGGTWALTPSSTGRVRVTIVGWLINSSATAVNQIVNVNYGTGAAPANGATLTGTAFLATDLNIASTTGGNLQVPFCIVAEVTGLTLSTAYWFDATLGSNGVGTASVRVVYTIIEEF